MEYKTQFEILRKIEELYSEISRITSQINLSQNNHEQIISEREKLFAEILLLQGQKNNLALGADFEEIKKCEQKIKALILSIMSDSQPIMEESQSLLVSMKAEIAKVSTVNQAVKSYAVYKK
jgi:hypothetical protein